MTGAPSPGRATARPRSGCLEQLARRVTPRILLTPSRCGGMNSAQAKSPRRYGPSPAVGAAQSPGADFSTAPHSGWPAEPHPPVCRPLPIFAPSPQPENGPRPRGNFQTTGAYSPLGSLGRGQPVASCLLLAALELLRLRRVPPRSDTWPAVLKREAKPRSAAVTRAKKRRSQIEIRNRLIHPQHPVLGMVCRFLACRSAYPAANCRST